VLLLLLLLRLVRRRVRVVIATGDSRPRDDVPRASSSPFARRRRGVVRGWRHFSI
jgi:hypothetical protein